MAFNFEQGKAIGSKTKSSGFDFSSGKRTSLTPEEEKSKKIRFQSNLNRANTEADRYKKEAKEASSVIGFAKNAGKAFVDTVSSVGRFGESLGQAVNVQLHQEQADENNKRWMKSGNDYMKLSKNTNDQIKQEMYYNLAQEAFDKAGKGIQDILGKEIKTGREVIGEAGELALDVATAGTYGLAAKGAKTGVKLAKSTVPTLASEVVKSAGKTTVKKVGVGAGLGYGLDVSMNLQNPEKEGLSVLTPGFATLIGAGLPALGYGAKLLKKSPAEQIIREGVEKGIKPSAAGKKNLDQVNEYYEKSNDAVQSIINNKKNLKFTDADGLETIGKTPETVEQFSSAISQNKRNIFTEYDAMQKQAGAEGARVTFDPISKELQAAIDDPVLRIQDPSAQKHAQDLLDGFGNIEDGFTTQQAQDFIQKANNDLKAFYRNPTYGSSSKVGIDAMVVNNMRQSLDEVIMNTTGEEYSKLKKLYGAMSTLEKDVNKRAIMEARKSAKGLVDFTDIFTYGDMVAGLGSGNPAQVARGVFGKGMQLWYKYMNDPNVIIRKMFKNADKQMKAGNIEPAQTIIDKASNKNWVNRMFPQPGKESPKEVGKTILNKVMDSKPGMSIQDVSKKNPKGFSKARTILAGAVGLTGVAALSKGLEPKFKTIQLSPKSTILTQKEREPVEDRKYIQNIKDPVEKKLASNWTTGEGTFYDPNDPNQTKPNPDGIGAYGRKIGPGSVAFGNRYFQSRLKSGEEIFIKVKGLDNIKTPYGNGVFRIDDTMHERYNKKGKFNMDFYNKDVDAEFKKKGRMPLDFKIVQL